MRHDNIEAYLEYANNNGIYIDLNSLIREYLDLYKDDEPKHFSEL